MWVGVAICIELNIRLNEDLGICLILSQARISVARRALNTALFVDM